MANDRPVRDEMAEWQVRYLDDFCRIVSLLASAPPKQCVGGHPDIANCLTQMDVQAAGVEVRPTGLAISADKPNRLRKIERVMAEAGLTGLRAEKRSAKRKAIVGEWPDLRTHQTAGSVAESM